MGLQRISAADTPQSAQAVPSLPPPPSSCQLTAAHMSLGAADGADCLPAPPPAASFYVHKPPLGVSDSNRGEPDMTRRSSPRTGRRRAGGL